MSISSEDDVDCTKESDGEYDSEHDSDKDMSMADDVVALCGVDLDGDVDIDRDGDDKEEDDAEEDDEVEKDEEQEDEDKEQDGDEDEGKESRTIGQGEMVNTSADNVDIMVDIQLIVLPEQGPEIREHTPRPKPPAPAPRLQTPQPCPRPRISETHPLGGLEFLGLVTPQKPHQVVPTLRQAEAAGETLDVDVDR